MYPGTRVLQAGVLPTSFSIEDTSFNQIFSEEEIKLLVNADNRKSLYNGASVRLDSVSSDGKCVLSEVSFFDFLSTNLTYLPASKSLRMSVSMREGIWQVLHDLFSNESYTKVKVLESKLKSCIRQYGRLNTFDKVIGVKELANIVTVSVLLEDVNGNVLLMRRGNKVVISSGNFAVAAAGSVAKEDLSASNPFLNCAARELREELNLAPELEIKELIISKQKLQPAVLVYGKLQKTFKELKDSMQKAEDFHNENQCMYAVPKGDILPLLHKYQFTDVAAYQLFRTVCPESKWLRVMKWCFSMGRRVNIEEYEI